ncbi:MULTISPECIES: Bug family tripartite tricarboxylate transporter substrate binding protein [Ramlibacter]|nr:MULTISPECIES: tripartite tricarboxylate transporter substrate binding protein [Ramlibacter]MBA2964079.1 tripartite tricarboxylate transporter substrate binding protein [Ramlibacter sp. CGMCC 1.13660]
MDTFKPEPTGNAFHARAALSRRAILLGAAAVACGPSFAQPGWPNKPLKIVVAYPPGGSADTTARQISERLARRLGQPVVVENRPGAGGRLGAQSVARSDPDGYTLLVGAPSEMALAQATVRDVPYDTLKDFAPITTVVSSTLMLVTNTQVPANTLAEFIAYAKANPGKINYASFGNNTTNHLYGEQLNYVAGINSTHIPYKGGPAAWADLFAGNVQYMFENAFVAMPQVKAGKMKALAVVNSQRLAFAPSIPTLAEAGIRNMGVPGWIGLFAPARTPAATVSRLHDEVVAILAEPDMARQLEERGMPPFPNTPEQFTRLLENEINTWKSVVARAGIKLE